MKNFKILLISGIFLFLSFLLGGTLEAQERPENTTENVVTFLNIKFSEFQYQQMAIGYRSKDLQTGVAILENGIEWLKFLRDQENVFLDSDVVNKDIAIVYVRLGNLHKKMGNKDKYESLLAEAVDLYNSTCDGSACKTISKKKMIWLVNEMDKNLIPHSSAPQ